MLINDIEKIEINEETLKGIAQSLDKLIKQLKTTTDFETEKQLIIEINNIRNHYLTLYWISYFGYLKNIKSEKYLASEKIMGKYEGIIDSLVYDYYKCLTNSENQEELVNFMGERPLKIAKNQSILLNGDIIELQAKEKELYRQYHTLLIGKKFDFEGHLINIAGLSKFYGSNDRNLRKKAYDKRFEILESMEEDIDNIFNELIKVRTQIANKLGFKSYTDIGFIKMNRIGYTKEDLKDFKNQIKKYIVPILKELKNMQKERLGLTKLEYYDDAYLFNDGNAEITGDLTDVIENFKTILRENCPTAFELLVKMLEQGLIDLEDRENKSNCGITTYLPDYKMPIFLKKYIGIEPNITSIFHEFGHSTQLYLSQDYFLQENRWPTFDICEIHSTSMEYLMYPFMNLFFGKDENKYKIKHLTSNLSLMVSMAMADDFSTIIYDNPDLSTEERKEVWKKIEKEYKITEKNHEYFDRGISWQSDSNRFENPFYAIDYAIANVCALSFYKKSKSDIKLAFEDYIQLCKVGGSISLKDLIKNFDLDNPFEENSLKEMCEIINEDIKALKKTI